MPTTTFADVKFVEDVENYTFEGEEISFEEGDIVSLPRHTAQRFVNQWGQAVWAKRPYEVRDEDYDAVVCRVRNQDGEPSVEDWLDGRTVSEVEDGLDGKNREFIEKIVDVAERKGVINAAEERLEG